MMQTILKNNNIKMNLCSNCAILYVLLSVADASFTPLRTDSDVKKTTTL